MENLFLNHLLLTNKISLLWLQQEWNITTAVAREPLKYTLLKDTKSHKEPLLQLHLH